MPKSTPAKAAAENCQSLDEFDFDDFPLDGFLNVYYHKGKTNENYRFKKEVTQRPLRPISQYKVQVLRNFLKKPLPFKVQPSEAESKQINEPVKMLLRALGGKTEVTGGYFRFLLGSHDCLENCRDDFVNENIVMWITAEDLQYLDDNGGDKDLRCMMLKEDQLQYRAENVVEYLASKIGYSKDPKLCDQIRSKQSGMKNFHPLVKPDGLTLERDAFLISYAGGEDQEIDLYLTKAGSQNSLFTFQKLKLNVDVLVWEHDDYPLFNVQVIPCDDEGFGRQANLDLAGRILHFESCDPKAWSRMNCLMTRMFRCPGKIPKELFINLKEFCQKKKSVSSGLVKLLKWDFEKHLEKCPKAWTAALFNACVSLQGNEFKPQDILEMCLQLKKAFNIFPDFGDSLWSHILEASQVLSTDSLQSLAAVQQFLALTQTHGYRPLNQDGVYLTRHDNRPSLLSVMEGQAVQMPLNLEKSLKTILDLSLSNDAKSLPAAAKLLNAFNKDFAFLPSPQSSVYRKFHKLNIDLDKIQGISKDLLRSRLPEFRSLGYKMLFFAYTVRPSQDILILLLLHYPYGLYHAEDNGKKNLIKFLRHEAKDKLASLPEAKFQEIFGCAGSLALESDPLSNHHIKNWLKTWIGSGHAGLSKGACLSFVELYEDIGLQTLDDYTHLKDMFSALELYKPAPKDSGAATTPASGKEPFNLEGSAWIPQLYVRIVSLLLSHQKHEYASELLTNAASGILRPSCGELSSLWLHCCDEIYHSHEKGFETALKLWREGHALNVWAQRPDVSDHRGFLVAFIEELYASRVPSNVALAHEALEFVAHYSFRDNLTQRIEYLVNLREEKIKEEKLSHKTLQACQLEIESALKREPHYSQNESLKKQLLNLLQRLSQTVADKTIQGENLNLARSLCRLPKVWEMLTDTDGRFLGLLTNFLDAAFALNFSAENHSLVWEFTDAVFKSHVTYSARSLAAPVTVRFIRLLVKVMHHREFGQIPSTSFTELRGNLSKMLQVLKHMQDAKSMCSLAYVLASKPLELKFSQDDFLDCILWGVLQIMPAAAPGTQDKKLAACLHILEKIQFLPDQEKKIELFEGCVILSKRLMKLKCFQETGKWVGIMAQLSNELGHNNEKILSALLEFSVLLFTEKQTETAALVINALARHSNKIKEPLFQKMMELSDEFLLLQPTVFAQLVIDKADPSTKALAAPEIVRKINALARSLINSKPDVALKLFESNNMPFNKTLEEIFYRVSGILQQEFKIRAWKLYQKIEDSLVLPVDGLRDHAASRKWIRCWKGAIKVLSTIHGERKGWKMSVEWDQQLDRLSNESSPLRLAAGEYKKDHQDDPIKFFLNCCLEAIQFPDRQQELLNKLSLLRSKLPKELEAKDSPDYQETDMRLLEKLANSKDYMLTYSSFVSFHYLIKNATEASKVKLYSACGNILRGTYSFSPITYRALFKEVDRVLTQFAYMVLPDEYCSGYEKILNEHPSKLTLTGAFLHNRELARIAQLNQGKLTASRPATGKPDMSSRFLRSAMIICLWILFATYFMIKKEK